MDPLQLLAIIQQLGGGTTNQALQAHPILNQMVQESAPQAGPGTPGWPRVATNPQGAQVPGFGPGGIFNDLFAGDGGQAFGGQIENFFSSLPLIGPMVRDSAEARTPEPPPPSLTITPGVPDMTQLFGAPPGRQTFSLSGASPEPPELSLDAIVAALAPGGANWEGVDQTFGAALARAAMDFQAETGQQATFASGVRTGDEQQRLYDLYLAGEGNLAAPPGSSQHEFGAAADVSGEFLNWLHQDGRAAQYGLGFPVAGEPWHVELVGQPASQGPPGPPTLVGPDFGAMNEWLERAAPQGTSPEDMATLERNAILSGLASGLAATNWRQEGMGRGIAAMAAGGRQGELEGQAATMDMRREDQRSEAAYAMARAEAAGNQASAMAALVNQNTQLRYQHDMAMYEAGLFKVLSVTGGQIVAQRGDEIEVIPTDSGGAGALGAFNSLAAIFGDDSPVVQPARYFAMFEAGAEPELVTAHIVQDLINGGLGSVFGQAYQDALADAQGTVPDEMRFDTGATWQFIVNATANILTARLLNSGDWGWLAAASAAGNVGAQMLMQFGTVTENGGPN